MHEQYRIYTVDFLDLMVQAADSSLEDPLTLAESGALPPP